MGDLKYLAADHFAGQDFCSNHFACCKKGLADSIVYRLKLSAFWVLLELFAIPSMEIISSHFSLFADNQITFASACSLTRTYFRSMSARNQISPAVLSREMLSGMEMSTETLDAHNNKLIARLPDNEQQNVLSKLEPVALRRDTVISEAGKPIEWVYFLTEGIGSVFLATPDGNHAEAGIFGSEGYIPTSAVTDVDFSPFNVNIQIDALGYRMSYRDFQTLMETSRPFAKAMIRAIEAFAIQLAYTAVSNAVHDVNERLARWLLMCHDRVAGDALALTHEFIS